MEENLEHLFYICPSKLKLWYDIAQWLMPLVDIYPFINSENILLGIYKQTKPLENSLILLVKRYIYINKWLDNKINFFGAKIYIKQVMIIELNVKCQNKKDANKKKWGVVEKKILGGL
jgi:hypothetical protein